MIELLGLKAVFVDIDPQTYNINPHAITKAITAQTKAIIAVSLYGQCADFKAINAIAMQHNLTVIEDAAQSMGASQSGCKSGSLSSLSTTSFFPSKPLGCYGDGGMIFTDNEQMANKLKMLRNHGQIKRYEHQIIGVNSRLDTMQAAILLVKLTIFEKEIELRQEKANYYNENLENIVAIPYIAENNKSVYAQYTININERDELREFLANNNIPTTIHYPKPLHLQPAFANYNLTEGSFSISEQAARKVLSLPMSPYITNKDQDYIIKKIKEFYGK
jgi:UDP-2-acetamido-2-deoxy-ribo-hexuluronate aminotransferase